MCYHKTDRRRGGKGDEEHGIDQRAAGAVLPAHWIRRDAGPHQRHLGAIQEAHLNHIPYENLDLTRGVPLSLEEGDLFEKLVTRRRGGYCFEQNGLLYSVLTSLGFPVTQYCGRFIDGEPQVIQERRHRVLRVEAEDGVFICDVGVYGESPRKPLRFVADEVQTDGIAEYKYLRDDFYGWVECQREKGKGLEMGVRLYPGALAELRLCAALLLLREEPGLQVQYLPAGGIFQGKASLTYIDKVFTIYQEGKIQHREEVPEEQSAAYLERYFGLRG